MTIITVSRRLIEYDWFIGTIEVNKMSQSYLVEEMQAVTREWMDSLLSFEDASLIIEELKGAYHESNR